MGKGRHQQLFVLEAVSYLLFKLFQSSCRDRVERYRGGQGTRSIPRDHIWWGAGFSSNQLPSYEWRWSVCYLCVSLLVGAGRATLRKPAHRLLHRGCRTPQLKLRRNQPLSCPLVVVVVQTSSNILLCVRMFQQEGAWCIKERVVLMKKDFTFDRWNESRRLPFLFVKGLEQNVVLQLLQALLVQHHVAHRDLASNVKLA